MSVVVCGRSRRPCGRSSVLLGGRHMPGPLQVIAMSFGPGSDFHGRVLAEVDRLQGRGVLRLLDLLFVSKRDDGTIERTVIGDDDFGALLSRIVPLGGAGLVEPAGAGSAGFDPTDAVALATFAAARDGAGVSPHRARLGAAAVRCDRGDWRGVAGRGFPHGRSWVDCWSRGRGDGRGGGSDCGSARRRGRRDAASYRGRDARGRSDRRFGSDSCRCGGRRRPSVDQGGHRRGGSHPRGY